MTRYEVEIPYIWYLLFSDREESILDVARRQNILPLSAEAVCVYSCIDRHSTIITYSLPIVWEGKLLKEYN